MKHYHKNPRYITDVAFEDPETWLEELGDLSGITHDLNSDEIPTGNQRADALGILDKEPVITERFDPPTKQGTVAVGYFEVHGERYNYRAVRWTPRQCEKANIVANRAGGEWDWDRLMSSFKTEDLKEWGFAEGEGGIEWEEQEGPLFTEDGQGPPAMELLPDERYDYVLLTFTTFSDFERAVKVLGLEKRQDARFTQNRRVGLCRVIAGAPIIDRLDGSEDADSDSE